MSVLSIGQYLNDLGYRPKRETINGVKQKSYEVTLAPPKGASEAQVEHITNQMIRAGENIPLLSLCDRAYRCFLQIVLFCSEECQWAKKELAVLGENTLRIFYQNNADKLDRSRAGDMDENFRLLRFRYIVN
jgi:hypothetical protein